MDNGRSPIHSRREPVEVEIGTGRVITIRPLPWRKRNDLGQIVVTEYSNAVQRFLDVVEAKKSDALIADFFDGILDWDKIFQVGLPDENIEELTWEEMIQVGTEMLKVNGLESQAWMIDPKLRSRAENTLNGSQPTPNEEVENGEKITSLEPSGSTDTVENPSTTSPITN